MKQIPTKRKRLARTLLFTSIAAALCTPATLLAQGADQVEEVVVTGSYIRNSDFTGASPVDTINQDSLLNSGSANIGQYIRDLTYTQNVDTVANVLGGSGGGQDSNSARFNLRGLGVSSTLTLFDGRRVINPDAISAVVPDIATSRIEVVLDGGSALYGSDAVAGVVNIIPIKQYDGFRVRTFYNKDGQGTYEEPKISAMWGKSFGNLDIVVAAEAGTKSPLSRSERSKYLAVDNATFIGAPGTFLNLDTFSPYRDEDCGTYNGANTDRGQKGSFPSGYPLGPVLCGFHYAQWTDYNREAVDNNVYANFSYEVSDQLTLEFQSSASYRESTFHTEPLSPLNSAWYGELVMPADHPANPIGSPIIPAAGTNYTMINGYEQGVGANPSYLNGSAYQADRYQYTTFMNKVGGTYEFSDSTWVAEGWLSYQTYEQRVDTQDLNAIRLSAALRGEGGPNGNEYFNPLASRDINSPSYVAGVTNNSQEVTDWLFESGKYNLQDNNLITFDAVATGEVLELPGGTVSAAFGFAMRDTEIVTDASPLSTAGMNASSPAGKTAPLGFKETSNSKVNAIFAELEIPILENLSLQVAARYEDFTDLDLDTTTPKVALRWVPIDSLSLRASWGESFLAPSASQVGPLNINSCVVARSGTDRLTGTDLLGVLSCSSNSPFVQPETSTVKNIGFTWEGIEGLSVSLDYQEIEYEDRIVTLASQDVTNQQFFNTLNAIGVSEANYDATPGSASRTAALAHIAANPQATVTRAADGTLSQVLRVPDNINSNFVDVIDFRVSYAFSVGDWGNFNLALDNAYYVTYDYSGFDGVVSDGLGKRNADTATAPPTPKLKSTLRLSWNRGDHAASFLTKYTHGVTFDGNIGGTARAFAPRTIENSYIANANYIYSFSDLFGSDGSVSLGINNLFDWEPARLPVTGGFESRLYDPFGRMFSVSLDIEL